LDSGIKLYDINEISIGDVVNRENISVFYTPLYNHRDEWQIPVERYIVTWHGPRNLEMPYDDIKKYYHAETLKKKMERIARILAGDSLFRKIRIKRTKKVSCDKLANLRNAEYITVSEHSRHSIIGFYPHLAKKQIPVFYSPFMEESEAGNLPQEIKAKTYFLLSSSARWEKNNLRAVWAFDELFSQRRDIRFNVVLTGVTNEKIYAKRLKNRDRFMFLDYVERAELNALHKNAYAFIYPSLNEGFGYPPLESMRHGIPVAASGTSSIPEICQDAVIYFDPYNVSEIKNRILQLLDMDIYADYSARAVERYKIVSERQKLDLEKMMDFISGVLNK
jgi:glycosyltransferase involved in cell wall biosynthesis